MKIVDPIIEILAIKLYEHDTRSGQSLFWSQTAECWATLPEEDREVFRRMARGEDDLY